MNTINLSIMKKYFLFLIIAFLVTSCSKEDGFNNEEGKSVTVNVAKAGTLSDLISSKKKYQITNLTITGYLNGTDIKFIREMAGTIVKGEKDFSVGSLSVLDLSGANIVAGGSSYYLDNSTSTNKIGDYTFIDCSNLTSVILPNSVTSIGNYAFVDCRGLSSLVITDSVTAIGNFAFRGCTGLTSVVIGNGVVSIGDYAFWGCTGLTKITIPDRVESIGEAAFACCTGLTLVNIPDGVTSIAREAFGGCGRLASITIPNSVTYVGTLVFDGCDQLKEIHCKALIPPNTGASPFYNALWPAKFDINSCKLYIPKGTVSAYRSTVWGIFANIIEE